MVRAACDLNFVQFLCPKTLGASRSGKARTFRSIRLAFAIDVSQGLRLTSTCYPFFVGNRQSGSVGGKGNVKNVTARFAYHPNYSSCRKVPKRDRRFAPGRDDSPTRCKGNRLKASEIRRHLGAGQ